MAKIVLGDFLTEIGPEEFIVDYSYENYLMDYEDAKNTLYRIYKECLISGSQVNEKTVEDLVVGNGFLSDVAFDGCMLREKTDDIKDVIDFFYIEENLLSGESFADCGTVVYEDGKLKAFVDEDAEMLTQLGTAIGELSILQKPEYFDEEGTLFAVRGEPTLKNIARVYAK